MWWVYSRYPWSSFCLGFFYVFKEYNSRRGIREGHLPSIKKNVYARQMSLLKGYYLYWSP